ncbi:MAG: hypothetical protein D6751_12135, partial [Deltaproteobacteria bacterium]
MTFLAIFILLSLSIVLHEAGHALCARLFGLRVPVFSLGFGRALFSFRIGGTEFRCRLLPLGGYVQLPSRAENAAVACDGGACFDDLSWVRKSAILLAGPLTSLFFAVALFPLGMMAGRVVPDYMDNPPLVADVVPESPAARYFSPGDLILAVNGEPVADWRQANRLVTLNRSCMITVRHPAGTAKVVDTGDGCGAALEQLGLLPDWGVLEVAAVDADSPLARLGVKPGDRLENATGVEVVHPMQLARLADRRMRQGDSLPLAWSDGRELVLPLVTQKTEKRWDRALGVTWVPARHPVRLGPAEALVEGWSRASGVIFLTLRALGDLVAGHVSLFDLGGLLSAGRTLKMAHGYGVGMMLMLLG